MNNWLFADTVKGAQASAALFSIVETAKANGLEPYAYVRHLFERLPHAKTVADFEALLPFGRKPCLTYRQCGNPIAYGHGAAHSHRGSNSLE
jgi:IS66 C-terminal element